VHQRHGSDVLDGEINRKILQQELNRKRAAIGEQDIDAEVARAADAYGFVKTDGKPDVEKMAQERDRAAGATVDLYVRDAVALGGPEKLVGAKVEVTDEDLRKGLTRIMASGSKCRRSSSVTCGRPKKCGPGRNNNTEPFFSELAQQYSIEPASRSNGARVRQFGRYGGSPLIEEEAFKLKAGELSGIVAIDGQFIVLRCQGRTRPVQTDFNAVRGELVKDIQEKSSVC